MVRCETVEKTSLYDIEKHIQQMLNNGYEIQHISHAVERAGYSTYYSAIIIYK